MVLGCGLGILRVEPRSLLGGEIQQYCVNWVHGCAEVLSSVPSLVVCMHRSQLSLCIC